MSLAIDRAIQRAQVRRGYRKPAKPSPKAPEQRRALSLWRLFHRASRLSASPRRVSIFEGAAESYLADAARLAR